MTLAFTVCYSSELPRSLSLMEDITRCCQANWETQIYVIDNDTIDTPKQGAGAWSEKIPSDVAALQRTYSPEEYRSLLKLLVTKQLFQHESIEAIIFFHPDCTIQQLPTVFEHNTTELLLCAMVSPFPAKISINEQDVLNRGIINPDCWLAPNNTTGKQFANWLFDRLLAKGATDLAKGLGSERLWLMHAPIFFENVRVIYVSPNEIIFQSSSIQPRVTVRIRHKLLEVLKKLHKYIHHYQPF